MAEGGREGSAEEAGAIAGADAQAGPHDAVTANAEWLSEVAQAAQATQETSISAMSLDDHLREAMEERRRQEESRADRLDSPALSVFDPIFSDHPFGLNEPTRAVETAKANAAKRERELSATKRAAQNRAAQRAFRQRKEGHIQELEQQVNRYKALGDAHKLLQIENHQLREYISTLQSTLMEVRVEVPSPPPGLELSSSRATISFDAHHEARSAAAAAVAAAASAGPATRAGATASRKRKDDPSSGAGSRAEKRQQTGALPAFGPVKIGLRGAERDKTMQNIEPRLMNA